MNVHTWTFVIVLVLVIVGYVAFLLLLDTQHDAETEERLDELEDTVERML